MNKISILFIVSILINFASCSAQPKTISSLAYDKHSCLNITSEFIFNQDSYTVYIQENNDYVPYLVLENTDDGRTLLLRKNPIFLNLNEDSPSLLMFDDKTSFYENSNIDTYLTKEYIRSVASVSPYILLSDIEIPSEESIGIYSNATSYIKRYIFLLSYKEVFGSSSMYPNDSKEEQLLYFKNAFESPSKDVEKLGCSWWLRTAYTINHSSVYYVTADGNTGIDHIDIEKSVRPAFYVSSDLKIRKDFIYDDHFYVLDIPD